MLIPGKYVCSLNLTVIAYVVNAVSAKNPLAVSASYTSIILIAFNL